eukprot:gene45094-55163_t
MGIIEDELLDIFCFRSFFSTLFASASSTNLSPPNTFEECVEQASNSCKAALSDGFSLLEVEFPPLPLTYMEDSSSSARSIADANTKWALSFARRMAYLGRVSVIYPDKAELDDALRFLTAQEIDVTSLPNVTLATIRSDSIDNAVSLDQIVTSIFGGRLAGVVAGVPDTRLYVAVVSSTQELKDLEKLHLLDTSIPIVFFNLRLDQLKNDLGLPLFPGRDLHYRFLSRIKPAYLIRNRAFSTSLSRPPF